MPSERQATDYLVRTSELGSSDAMQVSHPLNERSQIFVLSGEGRVQIDDNELVIRAGDFLGFPPNGPAHLVRNTSDADLVYLQGGDRRDGDRGRFPELGLVTYQHDEGHVALVPEDQIAIRPYSDWVAK